MEQDGQRGGGGVKNERLSVDEVIREARRLGIPMRGGKGAHWLLCPPGEPSVNVSLGHRNDIANPRAMKLLRRLRQQRSERKEITVGIDAPADIRIRAGAGPLDTTPAVTGVPMIAPAMAQLEEIREPAQSADPIESMQNDINAAVADAKEARSMLDEAIGRIKKNRDRGLDMVQRCNNALKQLER